MLKGYELKDGATYWIAAPSIETAFAVWVAEQRDLDQVEEMNDALASGIKLRELTSERMREITVKVDGYGDDKRSLLQVIEEQGVTPAVVACSEWP